MLAMNCSSMKTLSTCWSFFPGFVKKNIDIFIFRHTDFAPSLKGRYLSSNVNITLLNAEGQIETVPVGGQLFVPSTI